MGTGCSPDVTVGGSFRWPPVSVKYIATVFPRSLNPIHIPPAAGLHISVSCSGFLV
jgi:hypothetical protein